FTKIRRRGELFVEERNLLSVAYKNVIGARRASWRIISSIEQKEEGRGNEAHAATIRAYRSKIETELARICDGILALLDSHLVPSAGGAESKVFYLKMKGDYHRYLAEFKSGAERKDAAESTMNAYKAAQDIALADLAPTHPIRLGIALNFSVFYYKILNSPDRACNLAKQAVELIDAEIAQSFSQQRKKREGGGPTYHETFAYAQGPFACVPEAYDFVHVWHPHNQNVGATGSGLSGVATVSSTLGVLQAYSPNSTSASSSNLSTVHMGGLTCITQPTTELGSEDTVIAQFLSNPAQVGPSESPVLFSGTVGAASTFSPLASNDLPEISAMVPPPSTSADRLGPVLLGCIRDVLWHGHFLRYFSLQLIGDNSVLFHYRYLLILDRTNWKTNMLTTLLVPYIFFTLPNVLFSLIRGEVGKWIAIIAVILRLFFPRHFP
ncbi:hypothetical protein ACJX0J_039044, partial [Zea mays]